MKKNSLLTRVGNIFLAVGLSACGGGGSDQLAVPPGPAAATLHTVGVTATDASLSTAFGTSHAAYINAAVTARNRLFVFFGATDAPPQNYTLISSAAANAGFHSIALAYPNGPETISQLCAGIADPNCTGKVRAEVLTGADTSSQIVVSASNSVGNRLAKALVYLNAQFPGENWGQYLDAGGNVRWNLVRASGLSQGGGLAAYIAKTTTVDRGCYFSSPADWYDIGDVPPTWITAAATQTAASAQFGFNHEADLLVPLAHIRTVWTALGFDAFGASVRVDGASGFSGSHELTTALGTAAMAHTSTAADASTPLDTSRPTTQYPAGTPAYLPVWNYACFQ